MPLNIYLHLSEQQLALVQRRQCGAAEIADHLWAAAFCMRGSWLTLANVRICGSLREEDVRFLLYRQLKKSVRRGDTRHTQRTQIATLQSFHSDINHRSTLAGTEVGMRGLTEGGGEATAEKVMEEEAQRRRVPLWLLYEASNIQTWYFTALNLRNPAANLHLGCEPEQPTLWFLHFFMI